MRHILSLLLATFLFASCSTLQSNSTKKLTESLSAHHYKNIYFSAQPEMDDFQKLKDQGFVSVINLRKSKEKAYVESNESSAVKKAGLNYYHLPMNMKKTLTNDYVDQVTKAVVKHRSEGKVLVHCSSGNRVAIWIGAHFKRDHGQTNEEALQTARNLGLTKEKAEKKLLEYLEADQ